MSETPWGSKWSKGGHCKVTMNRHGARGQRWICLIQILVKTRVSRIKGRGQRAGYDPKRSLYHFICQVSIHFLTRKEMRWDTILFFFNEDFLSWFFKDFAYVRNAFLQAIPALGSRSSSSGSSSDSSFNSWNKPSNSGLCLATARFMAWWISTPSVNLFFMVCKIFRRTWLNAKDLYSQMCVS